MIGKYFLILAAALFTCASGHAQFSYVSDGQAVYVLDTNSWTSLQPIFVSTDEVVGIAVSPDCTKAYVAFTNEEGGGILVLEVNDSPPPFVDEVLAISVGEEPQYPAVTPNGDFLYVPNQASGNVSVIDTNTNTVIATILTGVNPRKVAISPDGTRALVADVGSNVVKIIDTSTNVVVGSVDVGAPTFSAVVDADSQFAYITSSSSIFVIDLSNNTLVDTLSDVGASNMLAIAITPDGKYLLVTSDSGIDLFVFEIMTGDLQNTLTIAQGGRDIAVDPVSGTAVVTSDSSTNVSLIDTFDPPSNMGLRPLDFLSSGTVSIGLCVDEVLPSPIEDLTVTGTCVEEVFLSQIALSNVIEWSDPGVPVTEYLIYRGEGQTDLIAVVNGSGLRCFEDSQREEGSETTYTIVGKDGENTVAEGSVSVKC